MSMGAYDEAEHERRERKARVDADFDDERPEYSGEVTFDGEEDTEAMLEQFHALADDDGR
ncbi:DUF5786 family protein [Halobaculum sp. MBLA0143]|uniref:DUF5786 family protein n=1 Tax=Halobaculum sp. MBLA0143 TaxID=3079933 RepID=UPI003525764C